MTNDTERWVTAQEAADHVGVHVRTIRRWAREGKIPAGKLPGGEGYRFKLSEINRLVENRWEVIKK